MHYAAQLRTLIEGSLAARIPSALTPIPRVLREVIPTGIDAVDQLLSGGLPLGAITEMHGPECSGRTSFALSLLANITATENVCAWVDVSNALDPESAAACGVDLTRMLWVRCGATAQLRRPSTSVLKPWPRIDQALRVTDLLLQAGGFRTIVLDMASIAPEFASRVPLATWFRYRAAAERTGTSIVLLTQHPCAKSSAGLVLRLHPASAVNDEPTLFTGLSHKVEIVRHRFQQAPTNVIPLRKPVQSDHSAVWQSRASWAGRH